MSADNRSIEIAKIAGQAASDKRGFDIVALDVSEHLALTDIFLIISAKNESQVSAVMDAIDEQLLKVGVKAVRREGERQARWVLLDFVDVVVHIQQGEERDTYSLERLWRDCPIVDLDLVNPEPASQKSNQDD